jgi:hypothetical protein
VLVILEPRAVGRAAVRHAARVALELVVLALACWGALDLLRRCA